MDTRPQQCAFCHRAAPVRVTLVVETDTGGLTEHDTGEYCRPCAARVQRDYQYAPYTTVRIDAV